MASRYGLQIRAATSADAAGIVVLMDSVGCSASGTAWTARLAALIPGEGAVLLADEWGPPTGLVALNWFRALVTDHPVAQISTLVVRPEGRRRGVGRLLLKAAAQAARSAGCGELQLLTQGDDTTLLDFADASGFEPGNLIVRRSLRKSSK